MVDGKTIESVDLETRLSSSLQQERFALEGVFSKTNKENPTPASRGRILELASSSEMGIAKSLMLEQLSSNPVEESLLVTMALLESYDLGKMGPFHWCETLLENYPNNAMGGKLSSIRKAVASRDWENASENSMNILDEDGGNWFALLISAKSHSALGNWEISADYWDHIKKIRKLSLDEIYDSARASYNAKRFSRVVEIIPEMAELEERLEVFLELLVRSHYNLRMDEKCIEFAIKLLEEDPRSKVGLRYYSRSLFRLGQLSEAVPIIERYCEINPFSVDAWESLIETQLMMDKVEESAKAWDGLRRSIGGNSEGFFTAIEIALRFHWREDYDSLIENEGAEHRSEPGFAENLAEINLKIGDLGGAWRILSSNGIDPMKSCLSESFGEILKQTNTTIDEIETGSKSEDSIWIAELVSREILRKARPRREVGRNRKKCHLISSSLDRGGAERQVAMTLKHIEGSRDFDCYLAVHRMKNKEGFGTYLDELAGLKHKVFDLGEVDFKSQDFPGSEIVAENSRLLSLLDSGVSVKINQLILHFSKHQPDLVHAWQDETILTSCLAAALTGVPVVLGSARSLRPDEKTELHIRKRPYLRNCFREIFNIEVHYLSTNSNAGKESYAEWIDLDAEKILVNENGVDFEEIESRMELPLVKGRFDEFGFTQENKIVGGIFRLEAGKRPELWIEAFEVARDIDPSLRGIIVGGGRMEKSVRGWVEKAGLDEFVKIVGETNDVGSWLTIMDTFLFTSITEGLPNVLIEAQGFGIPVVSTSVGGVPEVVSDRKTGSLVDSTSGEELGKSIIELFGREDFKQIGQFAKKAARERFSVSRMASRTIEMYSRVLSLPNDGNR